MQKKTKTNTPPRASHGYPVYRPTVSKILACRCGTRYIKTRDGQNACLLCFMAKAR